MKGLASIEPACVEPCPYFVVIQCHYLTKEVDLPGEQSRGYGTRSVMTAKRHSKRGKRR